MADGLTAKQQAFVEAYLANGFNATAAARHLKYANPDRQGYRLLRNVEIAAAVRQELAERAMPADEVLARLADQARGTMDDFLDDTGRIDLARGRNRGKLHLVKSRSVTKEGERIELYSAQTALELLAKHHALLTENVALSGEVAVKAYVSISPDEWDAPDDPPAGDVPGASVAD